MTERGKLQLAAAVDADDRARLLNELCREVLAPFVGRKLTPYLVAEAEGAMREALRNAVVLGRYVLPDGLELDRVVIGHDMRMNVLFKPRQIIETSSADITPVDGDDKMTNRFEAVMAEIESMMEEE